MFEKKTVIHPYTAAMLPKTEQWLCNMAANGWIVTEIKHWKFTFIKGNGKPRRYFLYNPIAKGRGIDFDCWLAAQKYANNKSKLKKSYRAFEVDLAKIDKDFEIYYSLRKKYYKKYYIGLTVFWSLVEACWIYMAFSGNDRLWYLVFALFIPLLYSVVSFFAVVRQ